MRYYISFLNEYNFNKREVYFNSGCHKSISVDSDAHNKREAIAMPEMKEQKKWDYWSKVKHRFFFFLLFEN